MRVVVNAVAAGAANRSRAYPTAARLRRTHNLADCCRPGRRSYSRQSAQLHRPLRRHRPSHRASNRLYRRLRLHRAAPRPAPFALCLFPHERDLKGPATYPCLAGNRRSMALTSSRRRSMSSRRRSMSAWSRSTDRSTPDSRPSTRPMRHATPMTERTTGMLRPRIVPDSPGGPGCAQPGTWDRRLDVQVVQPPRRSVVAGQFPTNSRPTAIIPVSLQRR